MKSSQFLNNEAFTNTLPLCLTLCAYVRSWLKKASILGQFYPQEISTKIGRKIFPLISAVFENRARYLAVEKLQLEGPGKV